VCRVHLGNSSGESYVYNADTAQVKELNLDENLSAAEVLMLTPEFSDPSSPLSKRTIYFEYDSSQVLNEFIPVIEAHGKYLMNNPNQSITLQGHSDERGTREYNIALAEQLKLIFSLFIYHFYPTIQRKRIFIMLQRNWFFFAIANNINLITHHTDQLQHIKH
jgi:hypothetical protein